MKTPQLIVITGFDGSGKTTMAKLLVRSLKLEGYRTKYVWIKSLHTLAYLISLLFKNLGRFRQVRNPKELIVSRFELPSDTTSNKIWTYIEILSVLPWVILKVHLPILFGFTIVSDRYLIDTVVSISMRVRDLHFVNSFPARLLLTMIPQKACIIHLDVELCAVLMRKPDIEYTCDEIKCQIALFKNLAKMMDAHTINTTQVGISETEATIRNIIGLG